MVNILYGNSNTEAVMKIMLVDDSISMLNLEKNLLKNLGYTNIVEARNGEEAMELLKTEMPVDVMFLDWDMPGMNGLRCLERLKHIPQYKTIKIIMCTAKMDKKEVIQAINAGVDSYIVKPINKAILKEKLAIGSSTISL